MFLGKDGNHSTLIRHFDECEWLKERGKNKNKKNKTKQKKKQKKNKGLSADLSFTLHVSLWLVCRSYPLKNMIENDHQKIKGNS